MDPIESLRAQHKKGVVVGLKDALGRGTRVDIDVLMRDEPKTFNLFILAMQELTDKKMAGDIFGYHQIAGIHGLPKQYWDGVQGKDNVSENVQSGYCAHRSVIFPTWHRPYLAMFEQALFLQMYDIAARYTDAATKASYQAAAKKFRLPYWDYFRPRGGSVTFPGVIDNGMTAFPYDYSAPLVFTETRIQVRMWPDDKHLVIPNPFQHYDFPSQSESPNFYIKEQDWEDLGFDPEEYPRDRTVRYPRTQGLAQGWSGDRAMNAVLNALRMDACRLFLNIMEDKAYFNYNDFATQGRDKPPPREGETAATDLIWSVSGSLENLHNIYHGLIGGNALDSVSGGGGHMSMPGIAAFDPIFWFHHCQIDRMFAIWQAATNGQRNSWFDPAQRIKDAPLLPARKVRGVAGDDFWTSNQSRATADFGYSYTDAKGDRNIVLQRLHALYNWSVPLNQTNPKVQAPVDMQPYNAGSSDFFVFNTGVVPPSAGSAPVASGGNASKVLKAANIQTFKAAAPEEDDTEDAPAEPAAAQETGYAREWFIDDRIQGLALNGSFTIFYFISDRADGTAPPNEADWALEPTLAGISHIFAAPVEHCDRCGASDEQQQIVGNAVAITSQLLDYVKIGQLADLEPAAVAAFLVARLKWRVQKVNGEVVDPRVLAQDKDFQINISCKKSQLPRNSGVATYEEYPDIIRTIIQNASASAS